MKIVYNFIEIIVSFIEVFICFKYMNLFVDERAYIRHKNFNIIIYTCAVTVVIFLNNQVAIFSNFLLILTVFIMSVVGTGFYKMHLLFSLTIVSLYYLVITIFDLVTIYVLSIVSENHSIGREMINENSIYRIVFICIMKLILCIAYYAMKNSNIDFKLLLRYWGICLPFCIVGYSAILYFEGFAISGLTELFAMNWLIFLTIALMFALLFFTYIRYRNYKDKNSVMLERNSMLEKNYNNIKKLWKDNEHIMHDFKNHIAIIEAYIMKNENNKAIEYISSIAKPTQKIDDIVWSGIEVIDIVLNLKMNDAKVNKIRMNLDINVKDNIIEDNDFCTILSNLLDNAIEASIKDDVNKRYIKFTMKSINKMLLIKVKNNMSDKPKICTSGETRFMTTKHSKNRHGIGIESVENCLRKYKGEMKIELGDDFFEVIVMIFNV